ncbi:MAG: hypothetical protein OEU76_05175 [Cyclobacteriaceae bacterium]|nr:hypothetical protein [Cyclobacteriaceae bacterium]
MSKRVLITPLDWGLGHATRCVPIIQELIELKCEVLLAGAGPSLSFLRKEFPSLKYVSLPGYDPAYPSSGSLMFALALQAARFVKIVLREQNQVKRIINEYQIDAVISDNRYGCFSKKVPCVFITHQLTLLASPGWGWLGVLANFVTNQLISKFSLCWVPDFSGSILTGKLSDTKKKKVIFIGPLSRFKEPEVINEMTYDVLALLSGPESQRSVLEELVTRQLGELGLKALIVRGVIGQSDERTLNNIKIVNHLETDLLQQAILQSRLILSRSGYSTIMDLARLCKKAIFIPTPGQTEQEYLAKRFTKLGVSYSADQNSFSLREAIAESEKFTGFRDYNFNGSLNQTLKEFLAKC